MGNFIASKLFVGITSFVGGVAATLTSKHVYEIVTRPKPLVFDHKAVEKLPEEAQQALQELATKAGLTA